MAAMSDALSSVSKDLQLLTLNEFEAKKSEEERKVVQSEKTGPKRVHEIGAHYDDIHAIIHVGKGFVTGSKDGWLKLWSLDGSKVKVVYRPQKSDYTNWITALSQFGSDQWLSGTRDGNIDLWDKEGNNIRTIPAFPSYTNIEHRCKDRNAFRINCLSQGLSTENRKPIFFAGWPTEFTLHEQDQKAEGSLSTCQTANNDFVFSVTQLGMGGHHLVVTGERLDVYTSKDHYRTWKCTRSLIKDSPRKNRDVNKRPYISTVTELSHLTYSYALAIFGGEVSIINLEAGKKSHVYHEHVDRVWTTVDMPDLKLLASCSDDHTIKLWDLNQKRSIRTLTGNVGRVSTLLYNGNCSLISGSCPDRPDKNSRDLQARLTFWDLRKT